MRADAGDTSNMGKARPDGRTESEAAADTTCFGFNLLKTARHINLIAGTALTVVCGLGILDIF